MTSNQHIATMLVRMLAKRGFVASLERQSVSGGELDATPPTWLPIAAVQAVWDNPRRFVKGVTDGAPSSTTQRYMTIAYRDDLKAPDAAVGLRVTVNGVTSNVISIGEIGERVGLRMLLDAGTEE